MKHDNPFEPKGDPEKFPFIESQLRYAIRTAMVIHMEDFYLRRIPLYLARKDHGLPWAPSLSQVWAEELGLESQETARELKKLEATLGKRSAWQAHQS